MMGRRAGPKPARPAPPPPPRPPVTPHAAPPELGPPAAPPASPGRLLRDAAWAVRFRVLNRVRRRLAVLRCDAPAGAPAGGDVRGVAVARFGPGEPLPGALEDAMAAAFGDGFRADQAAEAAAGATIQIGFLTGPGGGPSGGGPSGGGPSGGGPSGGEPRVDGPAGFVRTRPGSAVMNWHEELPAADRLVYAMATRRAARGRGVGTALLHAALADLPPGAAAWADTMVWNAPALAALRRAGFRVRYEADPLPDHPD